MANKSLFQSITSVLPRATVVNKAGGPAYKYEPKHALAQMAATGTFGNVQAHRGKRFGRTSRRRVSLRLVISSVSERRCYVVPPNQLWRCAYYANAQT